MTDREKRSAKAPWSDMSVTRVHLNPEQAVLACCDTASKSFDGSGDNCNTNNDTHRSTTDPDCRLATKSPKETAIPAYTVNAVMENRNRIIVGIDVESPQGLTAERQGVLKILGRIKRRLKLKPKTLGADKGFFEKKFIRSVFKRKIEPHIAIQEKGSDKTHVRVRMRERGLAYALSQRARKKIEELWGEAKEEHGFRRFFRRLLENVRQEALMIGWLLNLKRLATIQAAGCG